MSEKIKDALDNPDTGKDTEQDAEQETDQTNDESEKETDAGTESKTDKESEKEKESKDEGAESEDESDDESESEDKSDADDTESTDDNESEDEDESDAEDAESEESEDDESETDLATAIVEKDQEIKSLKNKYEKETKRVNTLKKQKQGLEDVVKDLVSNKLEDLSDEYKELMPEGDVIKQLNWLNKAESSGLINKKQPEVEIGRTMDLGSNDNKADAKGMSAHQKIANYFGEFYKK